METSSKNNLSSWWKRPDGKVGIISGFLGIGVALYFALPFLLSIAINTLNLVLVGLALFVLYYMIADSQMRTFIFYLYKSIVRGLTGILINLDPVSIIETYVKYLKDKYQELKEKMELLAGNIQRLRDKIEKKTTESNHQLELAKEARTQQKTPEEIAVYTRQAGRLQENVKKYSGILMKMETITKILEKAKKTSKVLIQDYENQVSEMKDQRETTRIGYNALKSAMSILSGDPDKKAIYDLAAENIQNDISSKIGAFDTFIEESSEIIGMIDLENGIFEKKGMDMLDRLEKNSSPFLLDDNSLKSIPTMTQVSTAKYERVNVIPGNSKTTESKFF